MQDCIAKHDCRLCGSTDLVTVLTLTPTPPGNHFVDEARLHEPQPTYPLELRFCSTCSHLQLGHVVDARVLYQRNYSYVSRTSPVFVEHLRTCAEEQLRRLGAAAGRLVVDVGSNDGTALRFYAESGCRVLGVDPATLIAEGARREGIPTLCEFFDADRAAAWRAEFGPASLIISHNTFAHIDDLGGAIDGVRSWLADDGLFVMEVGYALDLYQKAWFDSIYHEHLDYHSVTPLVRFLSRHGLEPIDVQRTRPQGGSIRVVAQQSGGPRPIEPSIGALIKLEEQQGMTRAETFLAFAQRVEILRHSLGDLLAEIRSEGCAIAGYGAPTKATTLLAHFALEDTLSFIVDDNPLKQGMFSPGAHIPVYEAARLYSDRPDFVLVLAWNFADSIVAKHQRYVDDGGRFILPMPVPRVLG